MICVTNRMPHCSLATRFLVARRGAARRVVVPATTIRPARYLIFSIFFPVRSAWSHLHSSSRTTMNTRCGTWIHLVRVAAIQPSHQFLRTRARRYVCTATPTPITDMETTFRSTDRPRLRPYTRPPRKIIRRPAARVNSDEKSRRSIRARSRLGDHPYRHVIL